MVATVTTENDSLRSEVETKIHAAVAAAEDAVHARLAVEWADRMQQEISSALAQAATQHEIVLQECREEQEKRVEEMTLLMRQQATEQEVPSGVSNHTYISEFTVHAHIISIHLLLSTTSFFYFVHSLFRHDNVKNPKNYYPKNSVNKHTRSKSIRTKQQRLWNSHGKPPYVPKNKS